MNHCFDESLLMWTFNLTLVQSALLQVLSVLRNTIVMSVLTLKLQEINLVSENIENLLLVLLSVV